MPPLKTYVFKHNISDKVIITIEVWGDSDRAWISLSKYVINTNDWVLQ